MAHGFEEPPFSPDDTTPTGTIRMVEMDNEEAEPPLPGWRRMVGLVSLLLAAALTFASALLILLPPDDEPLVVAEQTPEVVAHQPTESPTPTEPPPTLPPDTPPDVMPTISADAIAALLAQPPQRIDPLAGSIQIARNPYDPFTLIPDRPRSEVIEHTVQEGDTIFGIAERYGLKPETIAWSNDRSIIGNLRPGRQINILPVDGVYHRVIGSRTIADIAAQYRISDPYLIIDSEYNNLFGASPDTVLPSGTQIVIPGGVAEQIAWTPTVEREGGGDVSATGGNFVSFAPGEPGSCGRVQNVSGTAWARPISSYNWTRGFTSWHTGVDLAASPGTPVFAANGGVVIFAGWNSFGYGYTVVLSHGPFSTVYGHLSSINVSCRQVVSAGQVIGGVGSSGNSSGPHLHFEIRYLDQPLDPTTIIGF
jgi:murein DD-endopeptidase MepM/ murein hydrolase activator NlpD